MRDQNGNGASTHHHHHRHYRSDMTVLYVDLQRVHDRNTLRDRQVTALSLGIVPPNSNSNGSIISERRLSMASYAESNEISEDGLNDDQEKSAKKEKERVRYHRLDDRLRFANALVEANPADVVVVDSWPEECLMRTTFPALDQENEEDSYVIKTSFRPKGGRGTMIAMRRRCLVPEDDKHSHVGLIGLDRLVRRNWMPPPYSYGGCNQAWVHAVDAGHALFGQDDDHNTQTVRLAIVAFDCGRGYRFQNSQDSNHDSMKASLFSSRLFMNRRSSSFSNFNLNEGGQIVPTRNPQLSKSVSTTATPDTTPTIMKPQRTYPSRSNSTVDSSMGYRSGNISTPTMEARDKVHLWWRASTAAAPPTSKPLVRNVSGSSDGSNGSLPHMRERKDSLAESRQATPLEEAEERIRIAGELRQLKSFISVTLANQIGERRRHLERRASETALDRMSNFQTTQGSIAIIVGRFGVNSLPLTQSLATCANTPLSHQECHVSVCDNDRTETLAALWWRSKSRHDVIFNLDQDYSTPTDSDNNNTNNNNNNHDSVNPIRINDTTSLLDYNRTEWLEAEFECRPRMFTLTFH